MHDAEAAKQHMTALWVEHAAAVRRFARRRIGADDVEDVVAETFTVVWRRIEEVPEQALPWIYAVARNVIGTRLRSRERSEALLARIAEQPSPRANPAEVEAIERLHLAQAWSQLTATEREVIALVAWEGLSSTQAATVMQCLPSTFAVRLLRARRRLSHLLERGTGEAAPGGGAGSTGAQSSGGRGSRRGKGK